MKTGTQIGPFSRERRKPQLCRDEWSSVAMAKRRSHKALHDSLDKVFGKTPEDPDAWSTQKRRAKRA